MDSPSYLAALLKYNGMTAEDRVAQAYALGFADAEMYKEPALPGDHEAWRIIGSPRG